MAAVVMLRTLVVTPLTVSGDSMHPTFGDGDVVVVARELVQLSAVQRGDLVVFEDPAGDLSLKRVVGLPGEAVSISDAVLEVDGDAVAEPYVDHSRIDAVYFGPETVPPGTIFVMGDNRANSIDSRNYGAVPLEQLVGRVAFRLRAPADGG